MGTKMKKILEILIGILGVIATIIPIALIVAPWRKQLRNIVYNYVLVLQNDKQEWLDRLWQRKPYLVGLPRTGWKLYTGYNTEHGNLMDRHGFIEYRKVNALQFWLAVCAWGFLDDDANQDTTDEFYIKELVTGYRWQGGQQTNEKLKRWEMIFRPLLKDISFEGVVFGNAFDLGDVRGQYPYFKLLPAWLWHMRNSVKNFKYLLLDY